MASLSGEVGELPQAISTLVEREATRRLDDVFRLLLDEADGLLRAGQPAAAALVAGTMLERRMQAGESAAPDPAASPLLGKWRDLRDRANRGVLPKSAAAEVNEMIAGVRALVQLPAIPAKAETSDEEYPAEDPVALVLGKYAFVPTSSEAFLRRKREEVWRPTRHGLRPPQAAGGL